MKRIHIYGESSEVIEDGKLVIGEGWRWLEATDFKLISISEDEVVVEVAEIDPCRFLTVSDGVPFACVANGTPAIFTGIVQAPEFGCLPCRLYGGEQQPRQYGGCWTYDSSIHRQLLPELTRAEAEALGLCSDQYVNRD